LVPAVLLLLSVAFFSASARAAEPFHYPAKKHNGGELKYMNGLPVLIVEGTPDQIGEQVGVLGVKPGARLLNYPLDFLKAFHLELTWTWFIREGKKMLKQFPPDHLQEMEGIAKSSGIDRDYIVAGNTMFDLKKLFACSTLIVEPDRSATKGPLFGRNLDFPSFGYLHEYTVVTIYRPKGKHAFASVGFPGMVGCLSGMNDAGLSLAVLEVFAVKDAREKYDETGTPYGLCYRRLLEECTTVDEAERLLKKMKRVTTTNLAICDKNGGAVLEVTPKHVVRRPPQDQICACTNHFHTADLKPDQQENLYTTKERYQALLKSCQGKPKLDLADVQAGLHAANQGKGTLQTMIFEPAALRLHLAYGKCPSSALPVQALDLAPLFRNGNAPH
jgi:predicted choloylglycine hydrolase